MDGKYFQIIFFIIALIFTVINVYNRFFTKMVREWFIYLRKKSELHEKRLDDKHGCAAEGFTDYDTTL